MTDLSLVPITSSNGIEVIHGTYFRCWPKIKNEGLSRMQRNHIHFAFGLPDNKQVISGIRNTAQVFIYIDLDLALKDGLEFFKSPNGVILSPGNQKGFVEPKYFLKVQDRRGQSIWN